MHVPYDTDARFGRYASGKWPSASVEVMRNVVGGIRKVAEVMRKIIGVMKSVFQVMKGVDGGTKNVYGGMK